FPGSLTGALQATYSNNDTDRRSLDTFFNDPSRAPTNLVDIANKYSAVDVTGTLDGALFRLPGGKLRFSIGGGVLDENYTGLNFNGVVTGSRIGRRTSYAFGEIFAPLIAPSQNIPLANRLELSIAARYTATDDTTKPRDGRDFGDATDPKIGLLWAPVSGL